MVGSRSRDPLRLDPAALAFHQASTFSPAPLTVTEALERSPLFEVEYLDRIARAEWRRFDSESDASLFPLGIVTLHPKGVLLEAFGDLRLDGLRRCVNGLQSFRIGADEVRIVPCRELVQRPGSLIAPVAEAEDRDLEPREAARLYLRMAWPFLARVDLGHRAPHAVIRTGRGRREILSILDKVPGELLAEMPSFPRFEVDELREILLPEPESARPDPTAAESDVASPPRSIP